MLYLWFIAVIAILSTFPNIIAAEEDNAVQIAELSSIAAEPSALTDLDAGVKVDGESNREKRQFRTFGFGRPRPYFGGGGFYRPRPFYGGGGGFYRPRPYFGGGGFYRPRPFYGGGFYRPPPFYGGFYG